jgi:hypothetical protein
VPAVPFGKRRCAERQPEAVHGDLCVDAALDAKMPYDRISLCSIAPHDRGAAMRENGLPHPASAHQSNWDAIGS